MKPVRITLDASLVQAIHDYNSKTWNKKTDPSGIGALNAVAFIGERVAAIVARKVRP